MESDSVAAPINSYVSSEAFREILKSGEPATFRALLVLVGSLALFSITLGMSVRIEDVGILVFVLLFHEAGHFVGMRAFGYRDVRMFFIPFLGGAVSGKASGVAPYKQALVLLLGPLPGLLVALFLALVIHPEPSEMLGKLIFTLAVVNALNLLPFEPLDGGRLMHLILASRLRVIDVASLLIGGLFLGFLALRLNSVALGVASFFTLIGVHNRVKTIRTARALRESGVSLPERIEDAPDETLATLSNLVEQHILYRVAVVGQTRERAIVNWSRIVYDRALSRPLSVLSSFGFGFIYLLGCAIGIAALVLLVTPRPGQMRPLTQALESSNGRILSLFPAGFLAEESAEDGSLRLKRLIGDSLEQISIGLRANPDGLPLPQIVDRMSSAITSGNRSFLLLAKGGTCRKGTGSLIEFRNPEGSGTQYTMCVFLVGDSAAYFEILLPAKLYDADLKVMMAIGEAAEFRP